MARIQVNRRECGGKYFPRLCMRCGRPTDRDVRHTFASVPDWMVVLPFFGLLPLFVALLLERKTIRILVPMCPDHTGHWRVRKLYLWLGLLLWIACAAIQIAFADKLSKDVRLLLGCGTIVGALGWLVSAAALDARSIRAAAVHGWGAELIHVHPDFSRAWNGTDE